MTGLLLRIIYEGGAQEMTRNEKRLPGGHLGEIKRSGDLSMGPALQVVEQHHLPLDKRKLLESREQPLAQIQLCRHGLDRCAILRTIDEARLDFALVELVDCPVTHALQQPRCKAFRSSTLIEPL